MKSFRAAQATLVARSAELSGLLYSKGPFRYVAERSISGASTFLRTSRPNFGLVTFKLADIGEGIAEVELLKWHIQEGDKIEEMDQVCEIQSDKSAVEISSPFSGEVLKFHHQIGDMIKIGMPLMDINVEGEGLAISSEKEETATPPADTLLEAEAVPTQKKSICDAILASPACRRLAAEFNINLADVPATGLHGRITKEDLMNYKSKTETSRDIESVIPTKPIKTTESIRPVETNRPAKTTTSNTQGPVTPQQNLRVASESKTEVQLTSGVAKGMVKSMIQSLSIPMMSLQEEVDVTTLNKVRSEMKEHLNQQDSGAKLTVTPLIIKAVSTALKSIPILNSKFDVKNQDRYTIYDNHNVSIAIDTPLGLLVPNIKNVESLSLVQIQQELGNLASLAKAGKLGPNHLTGGTISISNVGVIGATAVRPILFDGQAAILGLGRVQKLPRYNSELEDFEPREIMNITATVDHRHVDGATVARFIKILREILENPHLMML